MTLFTDDKFVFPGTQDRFLRAEAIDRQSGAVIESWTYRSGSEDEQLANRSLVGFDETVCRVETSQITREDYKILRSRNRSPLVFKYGRAQ